MNSAKQLISPWARLLTLLRQKPSAVDITTTEPHALTAVLEENDRLFKSLLDAFEGMIYICSADYRIEYLNDRMIDHLGVDATGRHCFHAFGRRTICPWCINHRIWQGEIVRWETVSPIDQRWYEVVNAPLHHTDGTMSKCAIMVDINERKCNETELKEHRAHLEDLIRARTSELIQANRQLRLEIEERKAAEITLRENHQRYRSLFEGSRDAIIISDINGRLLDLNEAAVQLTGYSKVEMINKRVPELDASIDLKVYRRQFRRIQAGQVFTGEIQLRRKDGRIIYAEFNSKQMTLAGIACIHTTGRDITERKTAEEALRKSESKYRELVQNANSLIIRFDTMGRIKFFNEFAQHFFGYTEKEILGRSLLDTILPTVRSNGHDISPDIEAFLSDPEQFRINESENMRRNGERVWITWTNRPIFNEQGELEEFLCVGMDITERKRARRQIQNLTHELMKAQENERHRIARDLHDHIAQDLSSLKIRLQTLFETHPPDTDDARGEADGTLAILQRTISDVRNLAYDLRPPGLDQLGLVRTLYLYCDDFSQQNHLKVDFVAAGLDDLVLDEDIQINLYRLIQEALHNVNKHAEARGVTVRLVASSPNLMLRIIDDGKGFNVKDWRSQVNKEKRMGLQSMVERVGLLDGTIDIRSRPGKGAGIFITIPIKEQQRDPQASHSDH
ncbi:MAG: PAS domain S-box protein [Desulfatitalea sp.]|nr:PAS domain S-box protein [Desulfatitalea sp.]NNJ99595.1 PAS domain S-box protein [Desulfatitalea sp.]